MQEELDALRSKIDAVDKKLLHLLKQRFDLVHEVTKVKTQMNIKAHQPARFEEMLKSLKQSGRDLDLDENLIQDIWNTIHRVSIEQQNKLLDC